MVSKTNKHKGFHCKVITGSLMRRFLAETSKYGPSTLLRMFSVLLKERTFVFYFTQSLSDYSFMIYLITIYFNIFDAFGFNLMHIYFILCL